MHHIRIQACSPRNRNPTPSKSTNCGHRPLSERSPNRGSKRKDPQSKPSVRPFIDVHIEGESDEKVPVFDICAIVRIKIYALLDKKSEDAVPDEFRQNGKPKRLDREARRLYGQLSELYEKGAGMTSSSGDFRMWEQDVL